MRTYFLAATASLSLFFSCQGQTPRDAKTIGPKEFASQMAQQPDAQLLDVRTADEFKAGHLDNAVNIDWYDQPAFDAKISKLAKDKPVFVYCMAGSRSHKAVAKLKAAGFSSIYELDGGIMKWDAAKENAATEPAKIIGMCSQEFGEAVKSGRVLVDFYASWCEPCRKMAPYLARMEKENPDLKILRLNADEHKTLVKEMNVDALPTLLLYVDGKQTWKHQGFIAEDDLKAQIR